MPLDYFSGRADSPSPPLSPHSQMAAFSFSVADLSYQMSQYSLQQPSNCSSSQMQDYYYEPSKYTYPSRPSTPSTEPSSPLSTVSMSSTSTPPSSIVPSSSSSSRMNSGYYTANVRQQRQRALRRQCSASHLREISALVSRMVNEGDQCSVGTTTPPPMMGPRVRHNSDPTSDTSSTALSDYSTMDEDLDGMDDDDSEPESFKDACEGYSIQENSGVVQWHCPWSSKSRPTDAKCCVKKDTRSRKHPRRRVQTPA